MRVEQLKGVAHRLHELQQVQDPVPSLQLRQLDLVLGVANPHSRLGVAVVGMEHEHAFGTGDATLYRGGHAVRQGEAAGDEGERSAVDEATAIRHGLLGGRRPGGAIPAGSVYPRLISVERKN